MTDIVERLRQVVAGRMSLGNGATTTIDPKITAWINEAADEIERLRAALQRIDGINDNPAIYNPDIEAVLRAALDEQVAQ